MTDQTSAPADLRPTLDPETAYQIITGAALDKARGDFARGLKAMGLPTMLVPVAAMLIAEYEHAVIEAFVDFDHETLGNLLAERNPGEIAAGEKGAEALRALLAQIEASRKQGVA